MNLFKKALSFIVRNLSLTDPKGWANTSSHSYAGEEVSESGVLSLSAVWGCTRLLSGTIASLPLMVYRTNKDGGREVAKDHPLYRILHDSPNAEQTAIDYWEYTVNGLELRGNAYALKEKSKDRIVALTPISPALMQVERDSAGMLRYSWSENGKSFVAGQNEIFHIRGFGGSPMGGLSTLSYGRHAFGLATAIDKAAGSTFRNGLRPSGSFVFSSFLKPEQRAVAEEVLIEKFAGAVNAGRPLILEGGTKFEPITISPEDAQMLESRSFSVEEICRFFSVPPFMVGHTDKTTSWGTGLEQQILGFQKFTLRPRLKKIEMAIEKQLLSAEDRANGVTVEFNLEGLLRGDTAARMAFYTGMTGMGAFSINDVLALENRAPVPGGDERRIQMQNVPITGANALDTNKPTR